MQLFHNLWTDSPISFHVFCSLLFYVSHRYLCLLSQFSQPLTLISGNCRFSVCTFLHISFNNVLDNNHFLFSRSDVYSICVWAALLMQSKARGLLSQQFLFAYLSSAFLIVRYPILVLECNILYSSRLYMLLSRYLEIIVYIKLMIRATTCFYLFERNLFINREPSINIQYFDSSPL